MLVISDTILGNVIWKWNLEETGLAFSAQPGNALMCLESTMFTCCGIASRSCRHEHSGRFRLSFSNNGLWGSSKLPLPSFAYSSSLCTLGVRSSDFSLCVRVGYCSLEVWAQCWQCAVSRAAGGLADIHRAKQRSLCGSATASEYTVCHQQLSGYHNWWFATYSPETQCAFVI